MSKLIILSGISNSGKSSFTATTVQHNPERYVSVNRDKIRELLYSYTEETIQEYYHRNDFNYLESQVTAVQDNLINFWLKRDKDIIVDNTNLRVKYIKEFEKFGVPIEVIFFDVTLKEALTRNMGRKRKVDEKIIENQYSQYIELRKNYESKDIK